MFFTEFKWVEYFGQYYFYGEEKLTLEDAKVMYLHCYQSIDVEFDQIISSLVSYFRVLGFFITILFNDWSSLLPYFENSTVLFLSFFFIFFFIF